MRDLDQIQEHELDDRSRRLGTIAVAVLGVTVLALALGMVVGRAAEPTAATSPTDPLDALGPASTPEASADGESADLEAVDLTFPQALTGEEERPEVLAALRAAALEEASLAENDAVGDPAPERDGKSVPPRSSTLPAVVAAGDARSTLAQVASRDPLVAAAIERTSSEPLAPEGAAGLYTLHVISYDSVAAARRFVRDLRARGHRAFVVEAHVEGRSPSWRVRIGPFETRREANDYRETFEAQEGMNTFVVRRETDKPTA